MAKMANASTIPNYAMAKGGSGTTAGVVYVISRTFGLLEFKNFELLPEMRFANLGNCAEMPHSNVY